MARLDGNLFEHNFVRVYVLDVSDDYELMQDPLPSCCYPVIAERWIPRWKLPAGLPDETLVPGYLYDWHEAAPANNEPWLVGVVRTELADELVAKYVG